MPLASDPFEWFRAGNKCWELRRYGRQYTERNVFPGRRVELRRGYGASEILHGTIQRVLVAESAEEFFDKVSFKDVIPIAGSVGEATEIASRILRSNKGDALIGFEIQIKPQTIPMAARVFDRVRAGKKTTTVRRGHRRYPLGAAILVCADEQIPVEIVEVRHTRLRRLNDADALADGYEGLPTLLSDLRLFYPEISGDDEVTIVSFHVT